MSTPPTPVPESTATAHVAKGASAGASSSPSSNDMMSTSISSLDDLRNKAPKVYNAMMQGIAMSIVIENQHQQDKFKERWNEMLHDLER